MIIKANKRGGARQLAVHLLKTDDNEHVTVHEISGFMAEDVHGAMEESYALSKGTRCKKFLFSASFNPPENETVGIEIFENAINRAEETLNLQGQPRIIIFHEKEGRRHAHVAWSRIDGREMKAIRQDYYKNRLMDLAKELYLENNWTLPQGFIRRELRNPLNFSQEEWQQAKRTKSDPRVIKAAFRHCWERSDGKKSFASALAQHGYYLARGDRRGFVAVDWRGEVYSVSRWTGEKAKILKQRLGDASKLPSVDETRAKIDQKLVKRVKGVIGEIRQDYHRRLAPLLAQRTTMKEHHSAERQVLAQKQAQRWLQETRQRQDRMSTGIRGIWDRLTGKHANTIRKNEIEAYEAYTRDREQKERLVQAQLQERQNLQRGIRHLRTQQESKIQRIKAKLFANLSEDNVPELNRQFDKAAPRQTYGRPPPDSDFDLSM